MASRSSGRGGTYRSGASSSAMRDTSRGDYVSNSRDTSRGDYVSNSRDTSRGRGRPRDTYSTTSMDLGSIDPMLRRQMEGTLMVEKVLHDEMYDGSKQPTIDARKLQNRMSARLVHDEIERSYHHSDVTEQDRMVSRLYTDHGIKGVYDQYITLDSSLRVYEPANPKDLITFKISSAASGRSGNGGTLIIQRPIENVFEIEIGDFWFPSIGSTADLNLFNELTILIKNVETMSTYGAQGRPFHFIFDLGTPDSFGRRRATLQSPRNYVYKMLNAYKAMESLDLEFGILGLYAPITLPIDIFYNVQLTLGSNPAIFTTNVAHGLANGDVVKILEFSSTNPVVDDAMEAAFGLIITVTGATTFTVPVDCTTVVTAPDPFNVIVPFRRMLIPFRIRGASKPDPNIIIIG
jgi:hypothetical protein